MKCANHRCDRPVSKAGIIEDGLDAVCDRCLHRKHIRFMKKYAKLNNGKVTCTKGCPCGYGD